VRSHRTRRPPAGAPIFFAICEWGDDAPETWAPAIAQSYRAGPDHLPFWSWPNTGGVGQGVIDVINNMATVNLASRPYAWADPDFLETGIIVSLTESTDSETEFAAWAIMGGPMLIATDVRNMSAWKASVVMNRDLLEVNGDTTAPGAQVYAQNVTGVQVWAKPLSNGDVAAVFINANDFTTLVVTLAWDQIGWPASANVSVYDMWAHQPVGAYVGSYSATVSANIAATAHPHAGRRLTARDVRCRLPCIARASLLAPRADHQPRQRRVPSHAPVVSSRAGRRAAWSPPPADGLRLSHGLQAGTHARLRRRRLVWHAPPLSSLGRHA